MLLTIYVEKQLIERIDRLAAAENVSRSRYIEAKIADGIEDEERVVQTMTHPVIAPALMKALASPEILRAMAQMMKQDMNDDQLNLFTQTMQAASDQVQKKVARVSAKQTPRRGRRKGGKK